MSTGPDRAGSPLALSALALLLLSAAVIALELALMRCLSISRWHHFSYLVISTALLGFGAAGTVLTFAGTWLRRRFATSATVLTLLYALSVGLCFRAAESLPLEARYVLYSWGQAALMFLYHSLLLVPFFLAAMVIGLSLMHFRGRVHLIYGANLVGSGMGAPLALGLMFLVPAVRLLEVVALLGVLAALGWAMTRPGRRAALAALSVLVGGALAATAAWRPLELRLDQYKALSVMRRWEAEGNALHLATRHGPRARLDAYASPLLHQTLFAGLSATGAPPPQLAVLADGAMAATVFRISSADQAEILDHTPMSLAYRFLERPRVLLLGEGGGVNVWLARRMGAERVTVVQANPQLLELLRGELAELGGDVLAGADVRAVASEPRLFLERTPERYDLIQIVTAEGMAAGASSLRSLHEDFLLTRQGLALCFERLSEGGVLSVTRGVQAPPLAFRTPPTEADCRRLLEAAEVLALDIEWAPCGDTDYSRQVNQVEGPPGRPYSYFHRAAIRVLSREREQFFRDWLYNVRPATDDSPYFYNFFRWKALPHLVRAYGEQWLRRAELGYVVLVFVLAEVAVVGAALILLPLLWLRRGAAAGARRAPTGAYFLLLGLAFMMLEMTCLLKFTYFLGDPIYAAAVVIGSFLVFSGLGSAASRRLCRGPRRAICLAAPGIAALAVFYALGLGAVFRVLMGLPLAGRMAASVALTAPAAFLMGWPFPNGLALLERGAPRLVPWAWAANGFASVAASPLAVMIAIGAGYSTVLLLVAVLYLLAAVVSVYLPGVSVAAKDGRTGSRFTSEQPDS
ncbi:MAG: spermidine synthase family protein [Planctomycetota bacterium]|jgi:hypothetical protein